MIRNIILCAGIMILAAFGSISCGGGGSTPVSPHPQPGTQYRIYVLDFPDGGQVITDLTARQGVNTPREVRYDFRTASMGGNWSPVAQDSTLDVTIEGAPSGHKMPDIGLSGGQYRIRTGTCRLEFFPPVGGQLGTAWLVLKVRESGAFVRISLTVLPPSGGGNPPPTCRDLHPTKEAINGYWWDCCNGVWANTGVPVNPTPTCRDIHPTREAIGGYWWDCINGTWGNTGEPVNPPPPVSYTLKGFGAQGEFGPNGIAVMKGNGYKIAFELWGSDGSKVDINSSVVYMNSDILPCWSWNIDCGEFMTVLWANPDCPSLDDPGNMFIEPGCYPIQFEYEYSAGKWVFLDGTVEVLFNPDIP